MKRGLARETIAMKSKYFGDEIKLRAVRYGGLFEISKKQARRIPKDRGIVWEVPDHRLGGPPMVVLVES